ncbi:hypothetical protein [uncultured Adlercreutzia sp.]|uniref:hypothetical protein n=1 Tax=uncultured Adlercreutzia sp. TaxID=875803 RepID=UPI0026F3AFAA|nr:hypothetical protein [uncultured Adlercreutzia sp.]
MAKGLRIASWAVAIAIVALCDGGFLAFAVMTIAEESGSSAASFMAETVVQGIAPVMWVLIPLLQLASVVLGAVAAASRRPAALVTCRSIMLFFKVGLIPFFLCGAVVELLFIVLGLHPVLPFVGWAMGAAVGVMGWLTMFSGSIWAIATAVHLYRQRIASGGELAAHIVLQLMFVADVVDAVILFVRSKAPAAALRTQSLLR